MNYRFSDEFLAYLELKQDMLFHKIPDKKISYYISSSLEKGKALAQKYQGNTLEDLFKKLDILVTPAKSEGSFYKVKFRAQFEVDAKGNKEIVIYNRSIQDLADKNDVTFEGMKKIVLAHELFHFLEETLDESVSENLESIESFKFLGLSRKAKISRASEIAANAFSKTFLKLNYLPNYYDYQYILKTNQMKENELEEEYQNFERVFKMNN
ncbi:hypothetical protein AALM99_04425 [Lactococcus muris]|uniref:IrrE N-terminal-like domain-containing protein n=1 Tax=Lactococcus muris TaxID=2941330 RepID=A0ABV4D9Q3_9LACT|nr:hypothetical protein [Lactococcus garvieae]